MSETLFTGTGEIRKAATLSDDGVYRYTLGRSWGDGPFVLFLMLNPSTADALQDDPTIRRCIGFARSWGYGGLVVWNLYAYRATDPTALDDEADPIGRENEDHLWAILQGGNLGLIVAAWGANPNRGTYVNREKAMFWGPLRDRDVYVLGLTKDGHPRHPLYIRASTQPRLWSPAETDLPAAMTEEKPNGRG